MYPFPEFLSHLRVPNGKAWAFIRLRFGGKNSKPGFVMKIMFTLHKKEKTSKQTKQNKKYFKKGKKEKSVNE